MGLPTARMELFSAVALLLLGAGCAGTPSHFLRYYYLKLSEPNQEYQFFIRGYLDDQPIACYDRVTGKMKPLVSWMEEAEKEMFLALGWVFRENLQKLSKLNHQTEGLHAWQAILGCELRGNGSKGGFLHYGYDGMKFISFNKETLKWVAAQTQAEKLKRKWEDDPEWSEGNKDFLEETCMEWLQRYLSYRNKALQRIEPPVGKMTHKVINESLEVLICQASGFYSKEIQANWTRDGEVYKDETLHRNVTPNSDGTYYVRLSIDIDPKERDRFRCHLEHEGLQEPLVLTLEEETVCWIIVAFELIIVGILLILCWIIGIVAFVLIVVGIVLLICRSKRFRKIFHRKAKPSLDDPSGREDERLSESILQSKSTLDDRASDRGWSPTRALEIIMSTLRRREGSRSSDEQPSQKKAVNDGQKHRKGLTTYLQKR